MPANYYDDPGEEGSAPAPAQTDKEAPAQDNARKTDILPLSFFPDPPKPGDVCKLDVVKVHDDSAEVRYHPEGEGEEEGEGEGMEEAPAPGNRMDSMMEA